MTSQAKRTESQSSQNSSNSWADKNPFAQFAQMMPQFMDMNSFRDQYSEIVRDMSAANEVLMTCATEAARRNMALAQRNAQCFYDCSRDAMSSKSTEDLRTKNASMVGSIAQNCFDHTRENAEIASKAAVELVDLCNKRFSDIIRKMQK